MDASMKAVFDGMKEAENELRLDAKLARVAAEWAEVVMSNLTSNNVAIPLIHRGAARSLLARHLVAAYNQGWAGAMDAYGAVDQS